MSMAEDTTVSSSAEADSSAYKRLHITPFNPTLLATIIPASILPLSRNISYHSVQTFPEKGYGYVELPESEAQKVKKKFQGAILRGSKVKIEEARPIQEMPKDDQNPAPKNQKTEKIPSKKRKRNDETLPGAELRDRHVKRGWTDPAAPKRSEKRSKDEKNKKDVVKSKYTSGPECLFRTTLPANIAASTKDKAEAKAERRKRNGGKEAVVHEFAKTTKYATFLRSNNAPTNAKVTTKYVEGKGWVDEDGNIVEAEVKRNRPKVIMPAQTVPKDDKMEEPSSSEDSDEAEESDDSEDSNNSEAESESEGAKRTDVLPRDKQEALQSRLDQEESETSSSGSSSDEEEGVEAEATDESASGSEESSSEEAEEEEDQKDALSAPDTPRPTSSSTQPSLSITIPGSKTPNKPNAEVHPLEALYKRRQPDAAAPQITEPIPSFSFFGADTDEMEDVEHTIPMTPFTKQDFAHRGQRSAAPTPDTAHPHKRFDKWPTDTGIEEDDEDEDDSAGQNALARKIKFTEEEESKEDGKEAPVTDFQKWFYENRGETNRAWKRRRKVAGKEKRQRENRQRGDQRI